MAYVAIFAFYVSSASHHDSQCCCNHLQIAGLLYLKQSVGTDGSECRLGHIAHAWRAATGGDDVAPADQLR
eukprot:304062-Chlamydomonas_euryale.AAC.19